MSDILTSSEKKSIRFTTRDLVTIAVLSALGGVLSTYVGYLGNLVNRALGTPFGAGQFMAGLHVFWIVIAYGIIKKPGSATAVGLLKGVVELLTGSTHGLVIVAVSLVQGAIYDGGMLLAKDKESLTPSYLSAGLSAASNVVVFYLLYLRAVPSLLILMLIALAFASGIIFGGYFGRSTLDHMIRGGVVHGRKKVRGSKITPSQVVTLVFVSAFIVGGAYYYGFVYQLPPEEGGCEITGMVEAPFVYVAGDYVNQEVTVYTELNGSYTHLEGRNYTGVPLAVLLAEASPQQEASQVEVRAVDGYTAPFPLDDALASQRIILIEEAGGLRLVAADYDGSYWVQNVIEVRVV